MTWTSTPALRYQALTIQRSIHKPSKSTPFRIKAIEYTIENNLPYPKGLIEWAKENSREA